MDQLETNPVNSIVLEGMNKPIFLEIEVPSRQQYDSSTTKKIIPLDRLSFGEIEGQQVLIFGSSKL